MTHFKSSISILALGVFLITAPAHSTKVEKQLNKIEPALGNSKISTDAIKSAQNENNSPVSLDYNVYAGGLHALQASLELDANNEEYDVYLTAKTNGFIGKMFPWSATYTSSGTTGEEGELTPTAYEAKSNWKDKLKITELSFNDDGSFKEKRTTKKGKTRTQNKFKSELTQDAVDMLTGTVKMLQTVKDQRDCTASIPVFDGKRRFNMNFKKAGIDLIKKSKYSSFGGKALKCIIEVEPVAGFKKKDKKRGWLAVQEHSRKLNKMPTIWLGELDNGSIVPVRMEINSDYGNVVAHLTHSDEIKTP